MTSTISSKNKKSVARQFGAVYLWTLRRNLKLLIAYFLLLIITLPVIQVIFLSTMPVNSDPDAPSLLTKMLYPTAFSTVAVIFTLVSGVVIFSYLHNKRAADLFGALPVKRSVQFFARWLSAFTLSWAPAAIVTAVSAAVSPNAAAEIFAYFGWLTLSVIANLSMIAFLAVCAGSVMDVIVSYLAISAAWPLIVIVFCLLPPAVIPGLVESDLNATLVSALTPSSISYLGCYVYMPSDNYEPYFALLWWALFIAACLAGSALLIRRRKNECAQSSFAFAAPQIIIRVMCNFISGVIIGILFALIGSNSGNVSQLVWFIAGAALGSFAAHVLLQLIYRHRFTGFARTLVYYFTTLAVTLMLAVFVTNGWFGCDVYVPASDEIQKVEVAMSVGYYDAYGNYCRFYGSDKAVKFDSPEDIEKTVNAHRTLVENMGGVYPKPYDLITVYYVEDEGYEEDLGMEQTQRKYFDFQVTYTLKNGKKVERYYSGDINFCEEIASAFDEIFLNTDYIQKYLDLFSPEEGLSVASVTVYPYKYYDSETDEQPNTVYISDKNACGEIVSALRGDLESKEDIYKYVANYAEDDAVTVEIEFRRDRADGENGSYAIYNYEDYIFDESFADTLAALEKYGVKTEELFPK